jgi:hypothetical protein
VSEVVVDAIVVGVVDGDNNIVECVVGGGIVGVEINIGVEVVVVAVEMIVKNSSNVMMSKMVVAVLGCLLDCSEWFCWGRIVGVGAIVRLCCGD